MRVPFISTEVRYLAKGAIEESADKRLLAGLSDGFYVIRKAYTPSDCEQPELFVNGPYRSMIKAERFIKKSDGYVSIGKSVDTRADRTSAKASV